MSKLVYGEGSLGPHPELEIQACVDVELQGLEEMYISINFANLDFVIPVNCTFTYDAQLCECNIDTFLDETFDVDIPCLKWNCNEVVPELLKPYVADESCECFAETDNGTVSAVEPAMSFFSALQDIPPEVTTELQAWSTAFAMTKLTGSVTIFHALSAVFLF
ncbi:hypothetical protein IV203_004034 [Nitzschia inconspicua]|uniref:Uncharacterized protein n=1 Tax=Nitzschia inconspicua TaxID=303405 RepID=A0A9K3L4J3_9STRA|nr:hypothetical protein IV203_004034 [Nitzschia inconspicua]